VTVDVSAPKAASETVRAGIESMFPFLARAIGPVGPPLRRHWAGGPRDVNGDTRHSHPAARS
jgi:hypothetical protein